MTVRRVLLTLLTSCLCSTSVVAAEPIRLVGDEFCPYNCDPASGKPGYMVEVLEEIFAAQGLTINYRLKPWSRAVQVVANGGAQILLANTYNSAPDKRLQLVMGEDSTCFLTRHTDPWRFTDIAALQQHHIGVIQGYHYDAGGPLDQYLRSNHPQVYQAKGELPLRSLMSMLLQKRIDLVLDNCNVLKRKVSKMGIAHLTRLAGVLPGYRANLHIALSPADPHAAERLEMLRTGLNELRRNGRLAQILQRYSVNDWQTPPPLSLITRLPPTRSSALPTSRTPARNPTARRA
ncbi:ABC transporter substrate-binding protein, partial [Pseudomonas sp. HMWF032]|uniref:substrate-binding periplasmic protein n=1 Tax=Pseudomonas sp. HMWF032 TaxID=2056866 RepID=UPI001C480EFE